MQPTPCFCLGVQSRCNPREAKSGQTLRRSAARRHPDHPPPEPEDPSPIDARDTGWYSSSLRSKTCWRPATTPSRRRPSKASRSRSERSRRVTPGQRQAVANIEASHEKRTRSRRAKGSTDAPPRARLLRDAAALRAAVAGAGWGRWRSEPCTSPVSGRDTSRGTHRGTPFGDQRPRPSLPGRRARRRANQTKRGRCGRRTSSTGRSPTRPSATSWRS